MDMDLYFADGVMALAVVALLATLGPVVARLFKRYCPVAVRSAEYVCEHCHLEEHGDDFYCFFHKHSLYGK